MIVHQHLSELVKNVIIHEAYPKFDKNKFMRNKHLTLKKKLFKSDRKVFKKRIMKLYSTLEKKKFKNIKKYVDKSFVIVKRGFNMIKQREKLPIYIKEQQIMEIFSKNDVVIICGTTGCGKTTQIPQFLFEAGYGHGKNDHHGLIGVTEPRRVAAVNVSQRVGKELNDPEQVSYQIRYDSKINQKTKIKFMTDGILLREIKDDFLLRKYCVIILDEAHERNLNTEIVMIWV